MDIFKPYDDGTRFDAFVEQIEQVFTPFAPIASPEFFVGRLDKIAELKRELRAPGRQAILYGDRGTGKTSLGKVMPFFARFDESKTIAIRCTTDTRFQDIVRDLLYKSGYGFQERTRRRRKSSGGSVQASIAAASRTSSIESEEETIADLRQILDEAIEREFSKRDGLIIIDDYDKAVRSGIHRRVAEVLKQFSDAHCKTKLLVIGVAESVDELFKNEPSVHRSAGAVSLNRFSEEELLDIVNRGVQALNMSVSREAAIRMTRISDGFATHLHLIAMHAAIEAATEAWQACGKWPVSHSLAINLPHVSAGIVRAVERADQQLRRPYEKATRTTVRKTQLFQYVVWAMAMGDEGDVHISDIVENINELVDEPVEAKQFSYHLGRLQLAEKGKIIRKVETGVYRFSDPLMRGYVRLQMVRYGVLNQKGQKEFSFMRRDRGKPLRKWAPPLERDS